MRFEVLPDQGQVVIATGGLYFGTGLPQPIEIAVGAEVLPNQAAGFLVVWFLGQNLQHPLQGGHQALKLLTLLELDLLQLLPGALVNGGNAPDEHLGEMIPGAHPHPIDQRQHQGVALG
ncbi:hypothetical protein D3C80_1736090 [compost metagenome]